MINRRRLLQGGLAAGAIGASLGGYAFVVEPRFRLVNVRHRIIDPAWRGQAPLRIVALSDFHFCEPWMPIARVERIVAEANAAKPDIILLLGDYSPGLKRSLIRTLRFVDWSDALSALKAPLGVHAVLGNHDWWDDGPAFAAALERAGARVYINDSQIIDRGAHGAFVLSGTDSTEAEHLQDGDNKDRSDIAAALKNAGDIAPVIHMMHEPDLFVELPDRIFLALAGHTHGGQVRLPFLGRPVIPSAYGQRFAYGHIQENGRHLIVSGGLGVSIAPVRFASPPEITIVDVEAPEDRSA